MQVTFGMASNRPRLHHPRQPASIQPHKHLSNTCANEMLGMTDLDIDNMQASLDKSSTRFCAAAEQLIFIAGSFESAGLGRLGGRLRGNIPRRAWEFALQRTCSQLEAWPSAEAHFYTRMQLVSRRSFRTVPCVVNDV